MLRAHHAILAFIPCMFVGLMACSGEDADDALATVAEAEESSVRGSARIFGTFRDELAAGGVALLTLKTDSTYHMEEAIVCVRYPCELPELNGRYSYALYGGATVLLLKDESGAIAKELEIMPRGDSLFLREAGTSSAWQELKRSDRPWCEAPRDCVLQHLPAGQCRGAWTCATEVCSYRCGPIGTEPVFAPSCSGGGCPMQSESETAQ